MKLRIEKELFQWENERYVCISLESSNQEITFVQFYNDIRKSVLEIPVKNDKAKIPDYLLTQSLPIMAVACTGSKGRTQVVGRKQFKIISAKPEEFIENDEHVIYDGGEEV